MADLQILSGRALIGVVMSPKQHSMPLSGGDRKHLAKQLREAANARTHFAAKAHEARKQAARLNAEACRFECEEWSARMFAGGPAQPSPTIEQAIEGGCAGIEVQCTRCRRYQVVDLRKIRRTPETPLWKLEASFGCAGECARLKWKPKAVITGMRLTVDLPGKYGSKNNSE